MEKWLTPTLACQARQELYADSHLPNLNTYPSWPLSLPARSPSSPSPTPHHPVLPTLTIQRHIHTSYLLAVMRVVIKTRYSCSCFLAGNTYSPLLASQLQQGCGLKGQAWLYPFLPLLWLWATKNTLAISFYGQGD